MLEYKGYRGRVEYDDEADIIHGQVIDTLDIITFQGKSTDEIRQAFKDSIDDYLEWCKEEGRVPEKPFSGQFRVRVAPEVHRNAVIKATYEHKSLNAWIAETIERAAQFA